MVEVLTMCPTDWYVDPEKGPAWLGEHLERTYPLRVIKT
jgi:hypothetical protein